MTRAPWLPNQRHDIQAMLGSGFPWLECSRFLLLTIDEPEAARAWLHDLCASGLVHSLDDIKEDAKETILETVSVAFSHAGLERLGLQESPDFPFPTPFRCGMGSERRARLLREADRSGWQWRDEAPHPEQAVNVLIAHWWSPKRPASVFPALPTGKGFAKVIVVDGCTGAFRDEDGKRVLYEPFGFRDGASQPRIWDLVDRSGDPARKLEEMAGRHYRDDVIAQGEFILGYRNEYDELSHVPDVVGWDPGQATHPGSKFAFNGSYLAVRQIEQDVDAFEAMMLATRALTSPTGVTLADKLVGRSRETGKPLLAPGASPISAAEVFRYHVLDSQGLGCPLGSHIRRAHPRDALGTEARAAIRSAKLHRLIRRGRPYCQPREVGDPRKGLLFIACNADLERQFEFVLQRWLHNTRFADLESQADPIVGAGTAPRTFSAPPGLARPVLSLASFTRTLGGGYFFLPGLKALEFIVDADIARAPSRELPMDAELGDARASNDGVAVAS